MNERQPRGRFVIGAACAIVRAHAMVCAARIHLILGLFACLALPGASYLDGTGRLAYRMFAETRLYALDIVARYPDGHTSAISPTVLGAAAGGSTAAFFGGLDHFRRGPVSIMPRAHLDDIARFACRVTGAAEITLTWKERVTPDAPIVHTTARAICAAPRVAP
jgi:hypothetical protein